MADGVDGEGMSQVLNDTADESVFEFDDSYQRSNLSYMMDALLPETLYYSDGDGRALTLRGIQLKAISYIVLMATVFYLSYFFVDFNDDNKT
ncbi:hypothetical protein EJ419_02640, partial [Alloscardovia theropitheci]